MEDRDARVRDLQQQLHQLDAEAQGSALTPGEAQKNADQRAAVVAELGGLGVAAPEGAGAPPGGEPQRRPLS